MEENRKKTVEILLILAIFLLSVAAVHRGILIYQGAGAVEMFSHSISPLSGSVSGGIPSTSNPIIKNEYVNSSVLSYSNSNFWFNEKFYPGNVSFSSNSYSCSAVNQTIAPHLCLSLFTLFSCGGGLNTSIFGNLVGYLGFPQEDNNFPNSGRTNYSNLYSATSNSTSQNVYQLPSSEFQYQNFIDWNPSTIHGYSFSSANGNPYVYAINTSFTGYQGLSGNIPKSTLIIPTVSCGSTFINNYINYPGFTGTLYNISTLSGFTPSVFLASQDENGFGAYYSFGYLVSSTGLPWTGSFNSLLAYQIQSINPSFYYTMPTEGYAHFPNGNKGDIQYLNVSSEFLTPLTMAYYQSSNNSNVTIYVSNTSIASLAETASSTTVCEETGPHGACLKYGQNLITANSVDTFTVPDLEGVYYPNYANGEYVKFRTGGIFPICAWNSTTGNTLSSCTFEEPSTINNISYNRLWLSNNIKNNQLYNTSFSPGFSETSLQNNFTSTALNSFCFYNENFNTADGVYTSPSYTRVIPPISQENYTGAIGTCNAFFNNTNCFSRTAGEYLNFQDGIFSRNIACTSTGIHARNVTDAWIRSVYVANNAGNYCGDFLGQKNPSNPKANSTVFLQNLGTGCPAFNSNSSSVNLVVTVKNVGNTNITHPYLVALYGNNNLSTVFYNSRNNQETTYSIYQDFLSSMRATTGVIQVNYNNNFDTNMYVFNKGHILNPIPIQSLFSSTQSYENGPFNNSLLGMWIYDSRGGIPNNVIRTSNTLFVHSNTGTSNVPTIEPNGTATFTIEIPMSLFEALLSGKYNVSVFFGNTFNVTWNTLSGNSPQLTLINPGVPVQVNPLVPSSDTNVSQTHNNEIFTTGNGLPSPVWQYITSYDFNLAKYPFGGISIYSNNVSVDVLPVNSTAGDLNLTVNPSVSMLNGTGSYKLTPNQLRGSSISCFASPDNVQNFGVFWSKQIVSPSNLDYALSKSVYSGSEQQASNALITGWTGILFMPYSDQVALNYNNLPSFHPALSSFALEKPSLNSTAGTSSFEAFAYFGSGGKNGLFANLSSLYSSLNSTAASLPVSLPNSSLQFNMISNTLVSDPSILRVVGTDTFVNYSKFSNISFTFSLVNNGVLQCSNNEVTSLNGTFESGSPLSTCLNAAVINNSYINISSKYGPFFVDMYNNSNLNMSNETSGGTVLMAGNETLSKAGNNGLFMVTLPINASVKNGITLVFSPVPLSRLLYDSYLYLYNINGTPFSCNIVNDYGNAGSLGAYSVGSGKYFLPNGSIMCNLTKDFGYLRAVFINRSNGVYLGSGDIQSGLSIINTSTSADKNILGLSINGIPVNTQNLYIDSGNYPACNLNDKVVYNGILQYPAGCNLSYSLITFDYNNNGNIIRESTVISPKNYKRSYGQFLYLGVSAVPDLPSAEYNITPPANHISAVPVQFVLPNNFGGCNNIRVVTQSPYPYAEVPYQLVSSSPQSCVYVFIGSGGNKYSVFESSYPSITFPEDWISYNSSQYNVQLATNIFKADLISNCASGFGPCVSSFSVGGKGLGNLLFNNVSTSSATISQTLSGPVEDCFTVSYSSSQTASFPETGFGSINYANNKFYQTATPSQSINSMYCFYAGSSVISDSIVAEGSPVNFNVQDQLISNFSYLQDNNLQSFYVPPAINVGYSSYSSVNISSPTNVYYNFSAYDNILTKCINYSFSNSNVTYLNASNLNAINISSGNILTPEKLYCIYGGVPSYTTQLALGASNNANSSSSVGFAYQPGNYTNGIGTLYDSCIIPPNLIMANPPIFYLNGQASVYDASNSGENYMISHSANASGLEMLYSPSGSVFINSCSPNSTILSYSACTKPVSIIPSNGSYSSLEALPTGANGNFSFGGGCFIGSLNGISYGCAPTDGVLAYSYTGPKSSSSQSVSKSQVILNSTNAPTSSFSVSFDCSVSYDLKNSTNSSQTKTSTFSCSYPASPTATGCSASLSYSKINSTAYNITSKCSASATSPITGFTVTSDTVKLSNLNINGAQSEKTGLISNFICGNETGVINNNVINSWNWKPYSTAGTINPVATTNPNGVAEVGACEAGRGSFLTAKPNITFAYSGSNFQEFYSCESGYTGTITACSQKSSLSAYLLNISSNNKCSQTNITTINTTFQSTSVNGKNNGGLALSCNSFSKQGYSQPTVQTNCIAYHHSAINSTVSSYELQYMNSSGGYGIGLGILGNSYAMNVSIPNSKQQNAVKDAYFTGLSESQIEGGNNLITDLFPTSFLESNLPSRALAISAAYSYDTLNLLMLQNPSFNVRGIPGFVNGSILDYALSIFTGGTSGNCAPPFNASGYGIFSLGEGELCSGSTLPQNYKEGIFLSLGTLNEGLHSLHLYSVGNATNGAQPSVNVFDSAGNAVNLNGVCTNGNNRVFTSKYNGGRWSFNITSDQQCNPVNNRLYGYIINCLYQTPGNKTYGIISQYYLAYDLPTIWNISYSLLVSPKSYEVVPTPIYQINYSTGSILTLQQPNKTVFIEEGLPSGYKWSMVYAGIQRSSSGSELYYYTTGTHMFTVSTLYNYSVSPDCFTEYLPKPNSGKATSGTTTFIQFFAYTICNSYFIESGLPASSTLNWYVTYDSISNSAPTNSQVIEFTTNNSGLYGGNYSFSVNSITSSSTVCTTGYIPSPGSGYLIAGTNQSVSFSNSTLCTTTFTESNLPSGTKWSVTVNGGTSSSTSSKIIITTSSGTFSWGANASSISLSQGCMTTYSSPSGSDTAGNPVSVSFSNSTLCTTTFTESNLPSGTKWSVSYDSINNSNTTSQISFSTPKNTYSFSVSEPSAGSSCLYYPVPKSGNLAAGNSQGIKYYKACSGPVSFIEQGLPTSLQWSVTYDGSTKSTSTSNTITFNNIPTGYYPYSIPQLCSNDQGYNPSPSGGSTATNTTVDVSFSSFSAVCS